MSYSRRGNYGGGSSRGGFGGPKPVEVGKEYDIQISELSRQGDGIARIQGFVISVKGTKASEKVRIKVTRVGDRFANGEVVAPGA
jgi:predicted RNA-binding protein with TRAM domain